MMRHTSRCGKAAEELGMPITPHKLIPEVKDTFWVNLIDKGYEFGFVATGWSAAQRSDRTIRLAKKAVIA